jgi:hypothetical protein
MKSSRLFQLFSWKSALSNATIAIRIRQDLKNGHTRKESPRAKGTTEEDSSQQHVAVVLDHEMWVMHKLEERKLME